MKNIEKTALFVNKSEGVFFGLLILLLFGLNLLFHYHGFLKIKEKRFFQTQATVVKQYEKLNKKNRPYTVLKFSGDNLNFYTTTKESLKPLVGKTLDLTLITDKITFRDYLATFYAPSFKLTLLPSDPGIKEELVRTTTAQHASPLAGELFNALFFASPIGTQLRETVSDWGLSHLIALSGYHLGFLGAILFFLFKYPYTALQSRFFPYRNRTFDLSLLSAVLLFGYLLFTGAPPSLIRAFGMLAVGLFLFIRWIDLLNFSTLLITLALLIALIPSLLFSIGFWFSAAGVFYIYLFLHHTKGMRPWQLFLLLNLFLFVAMMPVVHFFFTKFTYFQLLSPLMTMGFALFYPLAILLHLLGFGGLMDGILQPLFTTDMTRFEVDVPLWFFLLYLGLSTAAIFKKELFYLYLVAAFGFLLYVLF